MAGIADLLCGRGWRGLRGRWFGLSRVGERVVTSRAGLGVWSGERHDIHGRRGVAALGEDFRDDLADQWHGDFGDGKDQSVERLAPDGLLEKLQSLTSGATLVAAFEDVGFLVVADDPIQFVHDGVSSMVGVDDVAVGVDPDAEHQQSEFGWLGEVGAELAGMNAGHQIDRQDAPDGEAVVFKTADALLHRLGGISVGDGCCCHSIPHLPV